VWGIAVDAAFRLIPRNHSLEVTMSQAEFRAATPYATFGTTVIEAPADARRTFIRKTYTHLAAAVYAFAGLSWFFLSIGLDDTMLRIIGTSQLSWLLVLGAFMVVSWIANSWALSTTSIGKQYAGLFLYVVAEAVIFLPLLGIAEQQTIGGHSVIAAAGLTTAIMFAGLTAVAFLSKVDFSFLSGFLGLSVLGAFALIIASAIFGFTLGLFFSVAMVVIASLYILYYTSQIMYQFRTDQYVAAALALFASVALLFWYVLQIFMSSRD
jgi:FtsH-binding integral membrane protein